MSPPSSASQGLSKGGRNGRARRLPIRPVVAGGRCTVGRAAPEMSSIKQGRPPPPPRRAQEDQPPRSRCKSRPAARWRRQDLLLLFPRHRTRSDHNKVIEISGGEDNSRGNGKYFRLKVSKINLEVAMTTEERTACCNS